MNALFEAGNEIQDFLQAQHWRFCIIGGLAVIRWGQPRATQDIDISLMAGLGSELHYIDLLLSKFKARVSDARQFALRSRVLLLHATNGVPLDIALAAFPFEEQVVDRASRFEFAPDIKLITASAEDVVVLKAFASRDRDWADVEGILVRQQGLLDWKYINEEMTRLCEIKESDDSLQRLSALRKRLNS